MKARAAAAGRAILFVDGDCVLCRRLSRIVLQGDTAGRLRVAPLAGVTARRLLTPADRAQDDWVVLVEGPRTLRAADAVVRTLQLMGGRFGLLASRHPAAAPFTARGGLPVRRRPPPRVVRAGGVVPPAGERTPA